MLQVWLKWRFRHRPPHSAKGWPPIVNWRKQIHLGPWLIELQGCRCSIHDGIRWSNEAKWSDHRLRKKVVNLRGISNYLIKALRLPRSWENKAAKRNLDKEDTQKGLFGMQYSMINGARCPISKPGKSQFMNTVNQNLSGNFIFFNSNEHLGSVLRFL